MEQWNYSTETLLAKVKMVDEVVNQIAILNIETQPLKS